MVRSAQVAVGNDKMYVLVDARSDDARIDLGAVAHNKGTASVFIGGDDLTVANAATTGYEIAPGEAVPLGTITHDDTVYAWAQTGTQRVDVLRTGVR